MIRAILAALGMQTWVVLRVVDAGPRLEIARSAELVLVAGNPFDTTLEASGAW
jgi:hypothetical protein